MIFCCPPSGCCCVRPLCVLWPFNKFIALTAVALKSNGGTGGNGWAWYGKHCALILSLSPAFTLFIIWHGLTTYYFLPTLFSTSPFQFTQLIKMHELTGTPPFVKPGIQLKINTLFKVLCGIQCFYSFWLLFNCEFMFTAGRGNSLKSRYGCNRPLNTFSVSDLRTPSVWPKGVNKICRL